MTDTATAEQKPTKVYQAQTISTITGKSLYWVRKQARDGNLPAVKIGRDWFFPRDEINAMFHICE